MSLILPEPRGPEKRNMVSPIARAGTIGLHLVSGLLAGGFIGYMLDAWLETKFCFLIFLALGFVSGVLNTVRDIRKLLQEKDDDARSNGRHTPES